MISKFCHWVSWLAVVLAIVATAFWIGIIADGNDVWAAFGFHMGAIPLDAGILVLGVVPSSVLYHRKRERRDWTSLLLTGSSFVIVLVEIALLLCIVPMRGEH